MKARYSTATVSQGNCIWISLDRPNTLGRLVSNRALRNCVSLRPCWARGAEHSFHLRHQREALTAKNFKCDCPVPSGLLPSVQPLPSIGDCIVRLQPLAGGVEQIHTPRIGIATRRHDQEIAVS